MHCIFIFCKPLPPALHSKYACSCLHVVSLIKIVHSDSLFRCHQWHFMKQMIYIDILHNHNFPRIGNCNPSSILSKLQLQMRQKLRENILHYYLPIDQIIDHQFCANCLSTVKWKTIFTLVVLSSVLWVVAGVDGTVVMCVGILSVCRWVCLQISFYSLLDEFRHWTNSANQAAWQLQPSVCITHNGYENDVNSDILENAQAKIRYWCRLTVAVQWWWYPPIF